MRSLVLLLALSGPLAAQGEVKSFPRVDLYTKDDPGAKTRAGYTSFGPFRFGDDHTTEQVAKTLGGIPLIWVETEHFKLGSGLPEYTIRDDPAEKAHLQVELERLGQRLPDVKIKVKKLDPWLRLHLFAQRLEELYAQFLARFGLAESEFPTTTPDPKVKHVDMGQGRYLGMSAKFTVLIFDKKSSLGRYSAAYLGESKNAPTRQLFRAIDSWLFVTAAEFLEGEYANDTALYCDVVTGVSQNLALGFRGYRISLPFAVSEGIAHWFSREIDPRYHLFTGLDLTKLRIKEESAWAPSVRARVEHKVYPSTTDMLGWKESDALEWSDHMILWSRMDYLLAREDGAAGKLLRLLKEPPDPTAPPPTGDALAERSRKAFETVLGGNLGQFDEDWGEWVQKTYPKK
jgi:hypothetical protein